MSMPTVIEGAASQANGRYAIVAAKFNREVVDKLLEGALSALRQHKIKDENIIVVWVPGSFEIPLAAQRLADTGEFSAVICLGAVIRGETDHYEHICEAAALGVLDAGLSTGIPVLFGILTCQTEELALARAGGAAGNKGYDAALAALEMTSLMEKLHQPAP